MLSLIRHRSAKCFFCHSVVSPADPRSFRCSQCRCWNRYDDRGELISDEPAMYEEQLNARAFSRRASPSKNSLPSDYSTGRSRFCHSCQTNQMISVNLMSNYLPPSDHPEYAKRLEQLPAYRESVHMRYPLVCAQCLPTVEDEIRQKDHTSRVHALAGFLKETKGKDRKRRVSGPRRKQKFRLAVWWLKGALWCITLIGVVACHSAAVLEYDLLHLPGRIVHSIPILAFLSLFYTTWDPTYSFKDARIQGRIRGKDRYTVLQLFAWLSRLLTSILVVLPRYPSAWDYLNLSSFSSPYCIRVYSSASLALEIMIFITSFATLHFQGPPSIRLIDTGSHNHLRSKSCRSTPELSSISTATTRSSSVPAFSTPAELGLSALTLSSNPAVHNPIFGMASLVSSAAVDPSVQSPSPIKIDDSLDEYAMDWSPTDPVSEGRAIRKTINDEDGSWLHPQRFFPPEQPTGLETLFANTNLDDGDGRTGSRRGLVTRWWTWWNSGGRMLAHGPAWPWIGAVVVLSSLIAYQAWTKWKTE